MTARCKREAPRDRNKVSQGKKKTIDTDKKGQSLGFPQAKEEKQGG